MFHWLYINYGAIIILFTTSFIGRIRKTNLSNIGELFIIANVLFIFLYVVHVPFNFTFRTALFFLPVLFIYFIKYLDQNYTFTKLSKTLIFFILFINIFMSIKYHTDSAGKPYHPTKLVYEKIEIITDTKNLAEYIKDYSTKENTDTIIYIGLGDSLLNYYLHPNPTPIINFKYSRVYDSSLNDLLFSLEENKNKNYIIVISANAIPNRQNELYERIYDKQFVTEANPSLYFYIENSAEFEKIYTSKDGLSSVYRKTSAISGPILSI
jgi:hypothetical protein